MLWLERGGPVMWPLLFVSLVALTFVIERAMFWGREGRRKAHHVVRAAREELRQSTSGTVHLETLVDGEQRRLEARMAIFDTIIAAAPMMGILGTVLGVIGAFQALAIESAPDPMAVTGGISEALISTASGLIIALSVLFPFNYFRTRLGTRLAELEQAAKDLFEAEPEV